MCRFYFSDFLATKLPITSALITHCETQKTSKLMAQKTSINIKPCLVRSSGPHNRRSAEYLANIRKEKLYIGTDLMARNEVWVAPEIGDTSLADYYNQIAAMVKEKTSKISLKNETSPD